MKTNPYSHTIMTTILITYSGIYNQVYTSGFNSINQIYKITIIHTCLAVISIPLAKIHIKTHSELLHKLYINKIQIYQALSTFCLVTISSVNIRFNFHTAIPIAIFSIAHTGHLLDITIPASRAVTNTSQTSPARSIYTYLTFFGGLKSNTTSLYLTDIAHHHLAIGIISIFIAHLYSSFRKAIGTYIRDTLYTSTTTQHIYSLTPYFYLSYDHTKRSR